MNTLSRLLRPAALLLGAAALVGLYSTAHAARIKEVASIEGVRSNQLTGYGLVIGLDGTGDQTTQMPYTSQTLANYLQQLGITLDPTLASRLQLKNVAAVLVTAELPAFARPGQRIDITVSSLGNAKSLKGGTLVATPLRGADGQIYALGQGSLVVAGAGASAAGSSVQINHLSAGRVPGGALVERSVPTPLMEGGSVRLSLNSDDFLTASRVAEAINQRFGTGVANAMDGRSIDVRAPTAPNDRIAFLAQMEELNVQDTTPAAKVIINSRTGSIVLNQAVTLGPCAIAHGNLSVSINSTPVISQPAPLSQGQTVVTEQASIQVTQEPGNLINVPGSPTLQEVVRALNALGATPQDLLAILQAIKAAGALNAELEVI
ncbi:flagellar basal body P-ring protein FlgI [Hylemonella gracilis]|uniref:Flagellar P-ring protein n=1 Tax=Hylemonella gracilis ATCC 19624 TaxID=887062 RepID=F3KXY9_9BURK|nr:flagellar basal body P-ring protein FlgI [Hylemonella gracilis]EGI75414.1 flagellar basal body P-ring protein [Hylemonella gracilis ATCC 19624]